MSEEVRVSVRRARGAGRSSGPARDGDAERRGSRREILDAAARLLRRSGYEAATTRAIAAAVGIKSGSIYHHFDSKDAIVLQVMNEGVDVVREAVLEALAALPADATPRRRLEAAVEAHLLSSLEHSDYTSASIKAFSSVPDAVRRNNRDHRRAYEDIWRQLFVELKEAGVIPPDLSLDALRLMILGSMNWAGEWYRPGRLTIASIARNFAAAVLRD